MRVKRIMDEFVKEFVVGPNRCGHLGNSVLRILRYCPRRDWLVLLFSLRGSVPISMSNCSDSC